MDANRQEQTSESPEETSKPMVDKNSPSMSRPVQTNAKQDEPALTLLRPAGSKLKQDDPPLTLQRPAGSKPKQDGPSLAPLRPVGSKPKENNTSLTLVRPMGSRPIVRGKPVQDSWPSKGSLAARRESSDVGSTSRKNNVDVSLRKPTIHQSDDNELKSKLNLKPNIDLKMRKDMDEDLANISLLQKPELSVDNMNSNQEKSDAGPASVASGEDNGAVDPETNGKVQHPKCNRP